MTSAWRSREASTVAILAAELLFFVWYLWPESGHQTFWNQANLLLILKYL